MPGKDSFMCDQCGFKTSRKNNLIRHITRAHSKVKRFKCPHCVFSSNSKILFERHEKHQHSKVKRFKCPHCVFSSNSKISFERHEKHHQSQSIAKPLFTCDRCSYKTSRKRNLTRHITTIHEGVKNPNQIHECTYDSCQYQT